MSQEASSPLLLASDGCSPVMDIGGRYRWLQNRGIVCWDWPPLRVSAEHSPKRSLLKATDGAFEDTKMMIVIEAALGVQCRVTVDHLRCMRSSDSASGCWISRMRATAGLAACKALRSVVVLCRPRKSLLVQFAHITKPVTIINTAPMISAGVTRE